MDKEKKKVLDLKKHVGIIHSANKISLLQRKIANGLLYNAYNDLLIKAEHQINIKDLCSLIGYDSNDHKTIKKALLKLLSTVIEWNLIDKNTTYEDGIWNASSIIADASIEGSVCRYSYSNRMKQLLYHPTVFGRINMAIQASFQSGYGLALYENCIRYQNLKQTPWIEFLMFRKLMGVDENKYQIFRDFKRRVLDCALREVNLYSPIVISYELRKQQHKISEIRFLIERKDEIKSIEFKPGIGAVDTEDGLYKKLKNVFGMADSQIVSLRKKHDDKYIFNKIKMLENSPSFLHGKIANLAKYLQAALEHDFQPPKSSNEIVAKTKAEQCKQDVVEKEQRARTEKLQTNYKKYQLEYILKNFEVLGKKEQENIMKGFIKEISDSVYSNMFAKYGLENILILERFLNYAKTNNLDILNKLESFEAFCTQRNSVITE